MNSCCNDRHEEITVLRAAIRLRDAELAKLKEFLRYADASGREVPPPFDAERLRRKYQPDTGAGVFA